MPEQTPKRSRPHSEVPPAPKKVRVTTCTGCADNQPNQLAHVDIGGCLNFEETQE
jgi:hypothetical protein